MSLNILIAEDNQFTAAQYDKILRKYGHNVTITRDGSECLEKYKEKLKKSEFESLDTTPFDVVVLDQSMPKKTGTEVAGEILNAKPAQKIIFASAYAFAGNDDKQLGEKIEFLQKPFTLNAFVQKIENK
jgi:CheY-like chemotaxis protein